MILSWGEDLWCFHIREILLAAFNLIVQLIICEIPWGPLNVPSAKMLCVRNQRPNPHHFMVVRKWGSCMLLSTLTGTSRNECVALAQILRCNLNFC